MPRYLYNATIIPEVVKLIAERYHLTEEKAMREFYYSETLKILNDPLTGVYA